MNFEKSISKEELNEYQKSPEIQETKEQLARDSEKHIQELFLSPHLSEADLRKIAELRGVIEKLKE